MMKRKICPVIIAILLCTLCFAGSAFADNLMVWGDFEEEYEWDRYCWLSNDGNAVIDDEVYHSGKHSMHLSSKADNDVRIYCTVTVKPKTYYTVKAFVKTKDVKTSETGATISVMGEFVKSESVTGTVDWRELEFSFIADEGRENVELCFTLGGYSSLNSGDVWFDDITMEECSARPHNCKELVAKEDKSKDKIVNYAGFPLNDSPDDAKWTFFAFLIIILVSILGILFAETDDLAITDKTAKRAFVIIMAAALMFRVIVGMYATGFSYDIGCFRSWSWYASHDLFNMYSSSKTYFLDYPPLYMYMLAPVGVLANAGDIIGAPLALLALKLPSIVADMVSAYIIYAFARNRIGEKWALVLGAFYVFNPMVWVDSVAWGQVDSIFAMFVIIELVCIQQKKWWGVGIAFALSVLLKPHGIMLAPAIGMALLIELFRNKKVKPLLITVGTGILTAVILLLPFYISTGFENPKWIIDLYVGTVDSYPYVTLNGFNFWAFLGYNTTGVNNLFLGLKFSQWGMIAVIATCVLAVLFSVLGTRKKIVSGKSTFIIVALFVLVSIFTFAHKMHERYMFAAVAIAILAFIETKDKNFLWLSVLFTVVVFLNIYEVYDLNVMWSYPYPEKNDVLMTVTSGLEVLSYVWTLVATLLTLVTNKVSMPFSLKKSTQEAKEQQA